MLQDVFPQGLESPLNGDQPVTDSQTVELNGVHTYPLPIKLSTVPFQGRVQVAGALLASNRFLTTPDRMTSYCNSQSANQEA